MDKFCIYCFNKDRDALSKSHLFPQSIGGRYYEYLSCRRCNSLLGSGIESNLKKSLFVATALIKLGIALVDSAFNKIGISVKDSDCRLTFKDGYLQAMTRYDPETGQIIGSPAGVRKKIREIASKRCPDWNDSIERQLSNKGKTMIAAPGMKYISETFSLKGKSLTLKGSLFPIELLAKIVYESLVIFRPFSIPGVLEFFQQTFEWNGEKEYLSKIKVNESFRKRIRLSDNGILNSGADLSKVEYFPFHQLNFRLSEKGTAFVRVNLFEAVSFIIVIEQVKREECFKQESLEHRFIFPVEKNDNLVNMVSNTSYNKDYASHENRAADECYDNYIRTG